VNGSVNQGRRSRKRSKAVHYFTAVNASAARQSGLTLPGPESQGSLVGSKCQPRMDVDELMPKTLATAIVG